MLELIKNLTAIVGAIVTVGGGLVFIAYNVFKAFGSKWLDQHFATQLEAFKHEQQKEIEHVRYQINSIFDRTVRLHQAEFEVLPELWSRLHESYYGTRHFVAWLSREPDLESMNAAHLDEFLDKSPLMAWQKEELRNTRNKNDYYYKAIYFHRLSSTKNAYYDFNSYRMKKGVFLSSDVEGRFNTMSDIIWDAIIEKEAQEEVRGMGAALQTDKRERLNKEGADLMEELRKTVQGTLRDSKAEAS